MRGLTLFRSMLMAATAVFGLAHAAPVRAADATPIVFVAAIIESGPFKVTDNQNLAGVRYAVDQINKGGGVNGHPIKLEVIDTELNAAATRRKVTDAILNDNAKVIIGASGSDIVNALVSVGQKNHVPVFAFAGEADEMTGAHFQPALFRFASNTSMHASAIVYAMKHFYPDVKKVFLLNEDYAFGHQSETGFKAALKTIAPGVEVAASMFHPRGLADFSPYLQQIQASGADFVLTADWGADLVKLLTQAQSFGLKPRIGGTFVADPEILKGIGTAGIGDIGADVYEPTIDTSANKTFVADWHASHATTDVPWPTASVGKAFITTELAAAIITKAGSTDFDSVIKAGEGFIYESVAGPLVIRACDHQVQIGQATGQVVPTTNNPYPFPFIGTAFTAPLSAIAVAPQNTGNPRCTSTASN